jgi:hypothetical protein
MADAAVLFPNGTYTGAEDVRSTRLPGDWGSGELDDVAIDADEVQTREFTERMRNRLGLTLEASPSQTNGRNADELAEAIAALLNPNAGFTRLQPKVKPLPARNHYKIAYCHARATRSYIEVAYTPSPITPPSCRVLVML